MNEQEQLFSELQEELKRDNLNKLWEKHGTMIIAACVAIVIGTGIGVAWKSYQAQRNQAYTAELIQALKAKGRDAQIAALEKTVKDVGSSQAALARLQLAAKYAEGGKGKEAEAQYAAVSGGEVLHNIGQVMAAHTAASFGLETPDGGAPTQSEAFYSAWREADAWRLYTKGQEAEARTQFALVAADPDASLSERARAKEISAFLAPAEKPSGNAE